MGNKSKNTADDKRFNVKWTEHWDTVFVDALVHQQSMGNRVDKVFTTAAYNNIVTELRDKLAEPFQKDHLKNRMKTLKHHFKECHYLFGGISDFTWSTETKLWTAEPEVWKDLIQVDYLVSNLDYMMAYVYVLQLISIFVWTLCHIGETRRKKMDVYTHTEL